ncbi:gametocyte-specific factor 1-like [Peromyscus californicus insignis]|uniref:gametocyte-specific factor 1-like n=1 Tax=Peromyscus californicus insignis TaxID=564181 RepID=UPI0022A6EB2E|nr:gametocyte-specific factor 1-like [Peromyscus californicus insignis]
MAAETRTLKPYDPIHRIPASRLQYHLASCKKKNPKIAKKMANCKYSVCHVVPIKRLKEHEANCVKRTAVDDEPLNLLKITCPSFEGNENFSNAGNQITDPDVWNVDHMHHSPSFVLETFAPKMLVCESDSGDLQEAMADKHPNSYKSWGRGQRN